jgi:hypothetical protein
VSGNLGLRVCSIALYATAAHLMMRYGMPWYLTLGMLLLIIFGHEIDAQRKATA